MIQILLPWNHSKIPQFLSREKYKAFVRSWGETAKSDKNERVVKCQILSTYNILTILWF
jgi:hypothetical protein